MSNSYIKVYLTKEITGWIIGKKGWRIKKIGDGTKTFIKYNNNYHHGYFSIKGKLEDVHQARIILQDLEKEYYKDEYIKDLDNKKIYIDNLLEKAKTTLNDLKNEHNNIKDN